MRQVLLTEFGGAECLRVSEQPDPEPPAGGYVVEIRAAGINYADVVERRGLYARDMPLPYALGKEASGVVVACGPGASAFQPGDRVIVIEMQANGCYAERVAVPEGHLLPARAELSFEQLAAYPIAYATAWYSMVEIARVRPGESVLIQAAAGGVGTAAVRLARAWGCTPIFGTAGGPEKCAWAEAQGVDHCIDYRSTDFHEVVMERTNGRGVDYVMDSIAGEVFERGIQSLAEMGRIVIMGFASIPKDFAQEMNRIHPLTIFHRSISVGGLNIARLDFPERRAIWDRLDGFLAEHELAMEIGGTFALEDAAEAHRALESRKTRGKLLLTP